MDGYASLGLLRNPFTAEQVPGVADPLWIETGIAPPDPGEVVQLIGPRGAGKTSQLLRWRDAFGGEYRHVPATIGRWSPLPCAATAYWDEADRIPTPLLRYSVRKHLASGAPLAVGTHVDLERWIGAGRTVRTVELDDIDGSAVARWAQQRIAHVATGAVRISLPAAHAADIASASAGSWRFVGDELHKWAAQLAASAVSPSFVR